MGFSKIVTSYIGSPISLTVNTCISLVLIVYGLHQHIPSSYWEEVNTYMSAWAIITADVMIMIGKKIDKDNERQMDAMEKKIDELLNRHE